MQPCNQPTFIIICILENIGQEIEIHNTAAYFASSIASIVETGEAGEADGLACPWLQDFQRGICEPDDTGQPSCAMCLATWGRGRVYSYVFLRELGFFLYRISAMIVIAVLTETPCICSSSPRRGR
jgi:hypothetical protein